MYPVFLNLQRKLIEKALIEAEILERAVWDTVRSGTVFLSFIVMKQ